MNTFLYVITVLVWGSTWIALKLQLGSVPIVWSIVWRFALAAAVLLALLVARRQLRPPVRAAWSLVAAQGVCLFCVNFICFMNASRFIPSGLVAVVFSTATLWNALGARWVFGRPLTAPVLGGGALGLAGLIAMFWPEIAAHGAGAQTLAGLGWALGGTLCFSCGNLLSARLQALGETPLLTNAWGMAWGALVLAVGSLAAGVAPSFDASPTYVRAWLYLAVAGSVVGFTAYLILVGRLGPERAAYCTVLFPLVALTISSVVEGYRFTTPALAGLALVMAGNVIIFRKPRRIPVGAQPSTK
ncbi:DMT family transporter [Ottowia sp. GY511]|uniref:DMT family transporter n=1 Tax=Ottowia flava TaxID=2675430 RepID=A0ABW4KRF1_9BURK|nr:DMT family transporter [Ottowia sp. GY511]TXK32846.1 DMT family transporter [Ottowia sp. GY511]